MAYLVAKDQNGHRLFVGDILPEMIQTAAHIFADPMKAKVTRVDIYPSDKAKTPLSSIPRPAPHPDTDIPRCSVCGAHTVVGPRCPTCRDIQY